MKKWLNGSCSRRASSGYFSHLPPPICPEYEGVWYRLRRNTLRVQLEMDFSVMSSWGHWTLAEVESIVNNTVLSLLFQTILMNALSTEPNHFLLQRATQLPPGVFVNEDLFSRKRWRKVQLLADHYWKRWIREYLPTLQSRPKWVKSRRNAWIGDLVLLAEDEVVRTDGLWAEWWKCTVCPSQDSMQRFPPPCYQDMPNGGR